MIAGRYGSIRGVRRTSDSAYAQAGRYLFS